MRGGSCGCSRTRVWRRAFLSTLACAWEELVCLCSAGRVRSGPLPGMCLRVLPRHSPSGHLGERLLCPRLWGGPSQPTSAPPGPLPFGLVRGASVSTRRDSQALAQGVCKQPAGERPSLPLPRLLLPWGCCFGPVLFLKAPWS